MKLSLRPRDCFVATPRNDAHEPLLSLSLRAFLFLSLRAPHPGAGILSARNPVQSLRARSFGRGNLLASKARLLHFVRNDRLLCRESFLGAFLFLSLRVKRSNLVSLKCKGSRLL